MGSFWSDLATNKSDFGKIERKKYIDRITISKYLFMFAYFTLSPSLLHFFSLSLSLHFWSKCTTEI